MCGNSTPQTMVFLVIVKPTSGGVKVNQIGLPKPHLVYFLKLPRKPPCAVYFKSEAI
jgi:hypothetical protein